MSQAAAALGIETLLDRAPGELSAGERQRVALAKATLRQPAVFLFDEPLSSLDACLRVEIRRELKGLHGSLGGTVIYVTHDQIEAMTLGDRVAVLDGGRLQQIGTPIEVYTRPANRFVAGFVGTPAMNFAEGVLRRSGDGCSLVFFASDGWHVPLVPEPRAELLDRLDRPIVLGLRPGDVQLQQGRHAADAAIAARVALVEPLGDATIVHLEFPRATRPSGTAAESPPLPTSVRCIVSKCDAATKVRCGEPVKAWFDMRQAHWFDSDSGANISVRQATSTSRRPAA